MRMRTMYMLLISATVLSCSTLMAQEPGTAQRKSPAVRNMDITGEIDKLDQGYIIRGKKPAEIFTILNPEPGILDAFVKSGKTIRIMVRIVSGDNVNIEKIDGKSYAGAGQSKKKKTPAPK